MGRALLHFLHLVGMECEHHDFSDGRWLLLVLLRVAPDIIVGMPGWRQALSRTTSASILPFSTSVNAAPIIKQNWRSNGARLVLKAIGLVS
eukprot:4897747-Amphidinium_carterae.1